MNSKSIALMLAAFLLTILTAPAADIYPGQPKMQYAHDRLMSVLNRLEHHRATPATVPVDKLTADLAMAKNSLDDAAKNKGSYRVSAINLIDQAKRDLEKPLTEGKQIDGIIETVKQALEKIGQGARAARR